MEQFMSDSDPYIRYLSQSLMTEEGFLNQACLNELYAALKNMPKTYDRLSNNKEWNTKRLTYDTEIVGSFSKSAIGCCNGIPPKLEIITKYLFACFRKNIFVREPNSCFFSAQLSLCEINKLLWDCLGDLPEFIIWNDEEYMNAENLDFIDLDAVLHQTCVSIREDRRIADKFNEEFDRKYLKKEDVGDI